MNQSEEKQAEHYFFLAYIYLRIRVREF